MKKILWNNVQIFTLSAVKFLSIFLLFSLFAFGVLAEGDELHNSESASNKFSLQDIIGHENIDMGNPVVEKVVSDNLALWTDRKTALEELATLSRNAQGIVALHMQWAVGISDYELTFSQTMSAQSLYREWKNQFLSVLSFNREGYWDIFFDEWLDDPRARAMMQLERPIATILKQQGKSNEDIATWWSSFAWQVEEDEIALDGPGAIMVAAKIVYGTDYSVLSEAWIDISDVDWYYNKIVEATRLAQQTSKNNAEATRLAEVSRVLEQILYFLK